MKELQDKLDMALKSKASVDNHALSLKEEMKNIKAGADAAEKEKLEMKTQLQNLERMVDQLRLIRESPQVLPIPTVSLPAFTIDHRFYVWGSTLTRDEYEKALVVDVVFLGKKLYEREDEHGVRELGQEWQMGKIASQKNLLEVAETSRLSCRIPGVGTIEAYLVPTATTLDGNVNDIIDILRCKLGETVENKDLVVEVIEEKREVDGSYSNPLPLISFILPWRQRTTGYLSYRPESTRLDPWKTKMDDIHLCVPGLRSQFTCPWLDLTLEFTEYHLQMGVDHIHYGVDYTWDSEDMRAVLRALGPYIDEGKVSVSSTISDGAQVGCEMKKIYHLNQCLLFAKGMARFVGIWDVDEFMIPRLPPKSVGPKNLVELAEARMAEDNVKEEDLCYFHMTSYNHAAPDPGPPLEYTWLGQIFRYYREDTNDNTWQKSLLSTRNIYMMGYHLPGACRSPKRRWTDMVSISDSLQFHMNHTAMFHFRNKIARGGTDWFVSNVFQESEYSMYYFPSVVQGLKRRKVDALVEQVCRWKPIMDGNLSWKPNQGKEGGGGRDPNSQVAEA